MVQFDYDPGLVAALKSRLPAWGRRWDRDNRVWLVAPMLAQSLYAILNDQSPHPMIKTAGVQLAIEAKKTRILRLEYLGSAKDRGWAVPTAYGHNGREWAIIFPLPVLQSWFAADDHFPFPVGARSYYGALGVPPDASTEEIKSAYRDAARRWHPDQCKAASAATQFRAIQEAYEALSDDQKRKRYDAARALASTVVDRDGGKAVWRPPSRSGLILADVRLLPGKVYVARIWQWQDIVDSQGRRMHSYWRRGDDRHTIEWR